MRWILLRGLAREAGHWGGFGERMAAAFPGARVATPDLPGCGRHHDLRAVADVAALMRFVRRQVGGQGDRVSLFGLSLGGMVAAEWARQHPQEVEALVLTNSSAGDLSPPWQRLRPGGLIRLVGAAFARSLRGRERWIYKTTSARPEREAEVVRDWVALARRHPVTPANAGRLLMAGARFRLGPPAGVPSLVLVGAGDRLVHPACGQAMANRMAAAIRVHPTAGHDLPLDEPDWVVSQVAAWCELKRIWNRPVTL